jgi:GxxExxY protein
MHGEHLSRAELNQKTSQIIEAAFKVHTFLGPGLLESAYQACLIHELRRRGFMVAEQYPISLEYEDLAVAVAYRADGVVDDAVVIELKAVEKLIDKHEAQLQTHLHLGGFRVGLLFNFHEVHLRNGIRRRVNSF